MKKFMLGLLAGVSAGILFAPKAGKKFREELKNSDEKFTSFGKALLAAAKDAGGEVRSAIDSKEVADLIAAGKKSADELLAVLEEKSSAFSAKAKQEFENVFGIAMEKAEQTVKDVKSVAKKAKKTVDKKIHQVQKRRARISKK